ncbi:MAG: PmoA family protein [Cytophagales bacterium]|nr:PmoA family protein [Cytophagales bacterium]
MLNKLATVLFAILILSGACINTITFSIKVPASELEIPFSINLDSLTQRPTNALSLIETIDGRSQQIPCQVTETKPARLYWLCTPHHQPTKRTYTLVNRASVGDSIKIVNAHGALTIRTHNKDLLRYHYKSVYPPAGVDTIFKRSGFIHPVWAPNGQILTRIQPPDHYHHYGIWNPWTRTLFENDTIDFWNLHARKGTVRFAKFISYASGPVFAEYTTLHEHVVFKKDRTEKIALNELQTVRVYKPEPDQKYYFVDITSKLSCASDSPLLILAYRYGGLAWRATEYWHKDNSEMLTSEGNTMSAADATRAKWIMGYGKLPENDSGGILILSHSANYNYPEPLRVWDKDGNNGRGDVFINFAPTKNKDWMLEPGKTSTLTYRLVVFNGIITKEKAESAWVSFTSQ